jgi:hypothetical protein
VQARTLALSSSLLRSSAARADWVTKLLAWASAPHLQSGPARFALLSALRQTKTPLRTSAWYDAFHDALFASEPYVVALASDTLLDALPGLTDKTSLHAMGLLLLEDDDPLLRSKGVEIVGSTSRGSIAAVFAIYERLDDPNPYIRSKACFALARMKHRAAIHRIVALLDDTSDNSLRYTRPQLEGVDAAQISNGSPWGSVQDAAVSALRVLSHGGLQLVAIDPRNVALLTSQNASAARAWYRANASQLPFDKHP